MSFERFICIICFFDELMLAVDLVLLRLISRDLIEESIYECYLNPTPKLPLFTAILLLLLLWLTLPYACLEDNWELCFMFTNFADSNASMWPSLYELLFCSFSEQIDRFYDLEFFSSLVFVTDFLWACLWKYWEKAILLLPLEDILWSL